MQGGFTRMRLPYTANIKANHIAWPLEQRRAMSAFFFPPIETAIRRARRRNIVALSWAGRNTARIEQRACGAGATPGRLARSLRREHRRQLQVKRSYLPCEDERRLVFDGRAAKALVNSMPNSSIGRLRREALLVEMRAAAIANCFLTGLTMTRACESGHRSIQVRATSSGTRPVPRPLTTSSR